MNGEEQEAIDGIVLLANKRIGQLTHVCSAVEVCFKKAYKAGHAAARVETLSEVEKVIEVCFDNYSGMEPEEVEKYLVALQSAIQEMKSTKE